MGKEAGCLYLATVTLVVGWHCPWLGTPVAGEHNLSTPLHWQALSKVFAIVGSTATVLHKQDCNMQLGSWLKASQL